MTSFWDRAQTNPQTGEILDGETRYLALRVDVLAATINGLGDAHKRAVLESFRRAVYTHGGASLRRYVEMLDGDSAELLNTVAATAADLGWGRWAFTRHGDDMSLVVTNSPYTEIDRFDDHALCTPILGLFEALVEIVLGRHTTVVEHKCAALDGEACVFMSEAHP